MKTSPPPLYPLFLHLDSCPYRCCGNPPITSDRGNLRQNLPGNHFIETLALGPTAIIQTNNTTHGTTVQHLHSAIYSPTQCQIHHHSTRQLAIGDPPGHRQSEDRTIISRFTKNLTVRSSPSALLQLHSPTLAAAARAGTASFAAKHPQN